MAAPDVCCLNPTPIFEVFNEFRLFMPTVGSYDKVPIYMNDGPRYFPADLPQEVWSSGLDMWKRNMKRWDRSQIIHNHMFWNQPTINSSTPKEYCLPKYAYQWSAGNANGIDVEDAYMVHLHGSRGITQSLTNMRKLLNKG